MPAPLRIAIAGLGTVGIGVIRMLRSQPDLISARAGREIEIVAVSARSRDKDRGEAIDTFEWEHDSVALASRADVDVFVEVMGGSDGPAYAATMAALEAGKDVVSANKALLATHGQQLAEVAEKSGSVIRYEAAIAGGIPVVKALSEGLAGNKIKRVMGVLNGTCNYILTRMEASGKSYQELFEEAGRLGYLEADPQLDVGGIDAGHKLALLSSLAFGTRVNFDAVALEGIADITIEDIHCATDMDYKIKLLGVCELTENGLEQRISPCLVPATSPLGQLDGGINMVVIDGSDVGQIVMRGAGAGQGPTASAVVGDLIDVARGFRTHVFGRPSASLVNAPAAESTTSAPYYLRLKLADQPGALAKICGALAENGVSISRMRQHAVQDDGAVASVLIVTHKTTRAQIDRAADIFSDSGVLAQNPMILRIEQVSD